MIESRKPLRGKAPSAHNVRILFHALGIILLLVALLAVNTQHAKAGGGALVVNSTGDGSDANPGDGFCATTNQLCTLRAALEEANAYAGPVAVHFNLSGGGIHVISPKAGPLPYITAPITLDATSQPNCTVPCVVLNGANLTTGPNS